VGRVPRLVDHDERRREITQAVWALLAAHGVDAVTFRTVAAQARVSVGRIQHYFAGRDQLVRHGCRAMVDAAAQAFGPEASGARAADPVETLRRLVVHSVATDEAFRIGASVWFAYLALSVGDPEIARIMAEAKQGEEDLAAHLIEAAQAAGRIRPDVDARGTARRLLAAADGLAARVLLGGLPAEAALDVLEQDVAALVVRT
jgi:AcrR family transcriptional regulator